MKLKIASDFEKLLDSVAGDAVTASIHWTLFKDLLEAAKRFEREMNQARAFWSLTVPAHREAVLFRLGRLYDAHSGALSLRRWLCIIQDHLQFFDRESFQERLKDNPFVETLSQAPRRPDSATLAADIQSVSTDSDPLVAKLCEIRNKVLSHRDPRVVLKAQGLHRDLGLEHVDTLVDRAVTLVNRYSSLFRATTYSTSMVGRDDYESMLKLVRKGVDAYEAEIAVEIEQLFRSS